MGRRNNDQGTIGQWRAGRHTAIDIWCEGLGSCGHNATVPIDPAWPDGLAIRRLRRRLVCRCGRRDPRVIPAWRFMKDPPTAWAVEGG